MDMTFGTLLLVWNAEQGPKVPDLLRRGIPKPGVSLQRTAIFLDADYQGDGIASAVNEHGGGHRVQQAVGLERDDTVRPAHTAGLPLDQDGFGGRHFLIEAQAAHKVGEIAAAKAQRHTAKHERGLAETCNLVPGQKAETLGEEGHFYLLV
jgi:hypothetical protein